MGTGFHIGQGYVITAAHVLDGATRAAAIFHRDIDRILPSGEDPDAITGEEIFRRIDISERPEEIDLTQVIYHADGADAALFRSATFAANDIGRLRRSIIPRPDHLYDKIPINPRLEGSFDDGMLMLQGVVLGYPPIPFSDAPALVAHEFHISAVIDRYDTRRRTFILSGIPRGGFSGAPAIVSGGWALGIVTEALQGFTADHPLPAPYLQTISLDPVLDLLRQAGVRAADFAPEIATYLYDN